MAGAIGLNAAEFLISRAHERGVEVVFANPGTTEMPFVHALAVRDSVRSVLCLHENVCSAAADGYGRIAGRPAMTLLHLGPGFANSIANLHNAKKAFAPVINVIGDHAAWHLDADAPLTMDISSLMAPVSHYTARIGKANDTADVIDEALAVVSSQRGKIASIIFPHDIQMQDVTASQPRDHTVKLLERCDDTLVEATVRTLNGPGKKALLLGGLALTGAGLEIAGRIADHCDVHLISETAFARMDCGQGLPFVERLPYFPEQAQALLDKFDHVVVCGTKLPVSFFGYENLPSRFLADRDGVLHLADARTDVVAGLQAVPTRSVLRTLPTSRHLGIDHMLKKPTPTLSTPTVWRRCWSRPFRNIPSSFRQL